MNSLLFSLNTLLACTICWSGEDRTMNAANLAVGFMFLILLTVLGSVLGFIFVLARRAKRAQPVLVRTSSSKAG